MQSSLINCSKQHSTLQGDSQCNHQVILQFGWNCGDVGRCQKVEEKNTAASRERKVLIYRLNESATRLKLFQNEFLHNDLKNKYSTQNGQYINLGDVGNQSEND